MKKIILISALAFILLFSADVHASGYGARAGLNFSFFSSNEIVSNERMVEVLSDTYTGFHIGGIGYISLFNVFLQPELLYTQSGQEISVKTRNQEDMPVFDNPVFFTNRFHNISIPFAVGLEFGPFRVGIGPVASFIVSSSIDDNVLLEGIDFSYDTASLGYQALAGMKLGSLILDLKYEGGFSKFGDGISFSNQTFDFETSKRQFLISLGILLN
jgi:hypothetical protein